MKTLPFIDLTSNEQQVKHSAALKASRGLLCSCHLIYLHVLSVVFTNIKKEDVADTVNASLLASLAFPSQSLLLH